MKKLNIILFSFLILVLNVSTVNAKNFVVDDANLFSPTDKNELEEKAKEISDKLDFDFVIVTTKNTNGKSSMVYADDYYDYNGYRDNGILMLINMQKNEVWLSTTGTGISYFTDANIDTMLDKIAPKLTDKKYHNASTIFLDKGYIHVAKKMNKLTIMERLTYSLKNTAKYFIGILIISAGYVAIIYFNTNKKKKASTSNYLGKDGLKLSKTTDVFLTTHTTKTYVPPASSSSSGGSSTHTGSSGTSHGGGGRGF